MDASLKPCMELDRGITRSTGGATRGHRRGGGVVSPLPKRTNGRLAACFQSRQGRITRSVSVWQQSIMTQGY